VPHGVDFLPESIDAARAQGAPAHRDHNTVADANDFEAGRRFALVLTSLCYVLPSTRAEFVARCGRWLEPGGWLVLYEYCGSPLFEDLLEICARQPFLIGSASVSSLQLEGCRSHSRLFNPCCGGWCS